MASNGKQWYALVLEIVKCQDAQILENVLVEHHAAVVCNNSGCCSTQDSTRGDGPDKSKGVLGRKERKKKSMENGWTKTLNSIRIMCVEPVPPWLITTAMLVPTGWRANFMRAIFISTVCGGGGQRAKGNLVKKQT